jgi:uncharacterized protein
MPFYYYDPTFLLLIPAIVLAMYAQLKVQNSYSKYSKVPAASGITGAQLCYRLLQQGGINDIDIEQIPGNLTDHYDPRAKKLRLSSDVYNNHSVAALGIVAHEVGHVLQEKDHYSPLKLRNFILPAASFGPTLSFPLFFMGLIFSLPFLMDIGIIVFSAAVVFQVITLPVEFNASRRAAFLLQEGGFLNQDELKMAKTVLSAASLTYIAASAMAIINLLRLILLRDRR